MAQNYFDQFDAPAAKPGNFFDQFDPKPPESESALTPVKEAGKAFLRGAADILPEAVQGGAEVLGAGARRLGLPEPPDLGVTAAAKGVQQAADASLAPGPGYENSLTTRIGETAGGLAPYALSFLAGPFGIAAATGVGGMQGAHGASQRADAAQQQGKSFGQSDADWETLGDAAVGTLMGVVPGMNQLMRAIPATARKGIVGYASRSLVSGGFAGGVGAAQSALSDAIEQYTVNPDKVVGEGAGQAGAIMAVAGALTHGLVTEPAMKATGHARTPQEAAQQQQQTMDAVVQKSATQSDLDTLNDQINAAATGNVPPEPPAAPPPAPTPPPVPAPEAAPARSSVEASNARATANREALLKDLESPAQPPAPDLFARPLPQDEIQAKAQRVGDLEADRLAADRGEPAAGSPSQPFSAMVEDAAAEIAPDAGRRAAPVNIERPEDVATAERHVNTEPSEAQKEAGNYQKGHAKFQGLDITIENPAGSIRQGPKNDEGVPAWQSEMPAAYGYLKRTVGADEQHLDTFLGPNPKSDKVFVIDQIDPKTGGFDETKTVLGTDSAQQALEIYSRSFSDGSGLTRASAINQMTMAQFKDWLGGGKTTRPAQEAVPPEASMSRPPPADKAPRRPMDLLEFIASKGGIEDQTGELQGMDAHLWHRGPRTPAKAGKTRGGEQRPRDFSGSFRGRLINAEGLSPDYMREAAAEAGYIPRETGVDELYDAIQRNLAGNHVFSANDYGATQDWRHLQQTHMEWDDQVRQVADELGVLYSEDTPTSELIKEIERRRADAIPPEEAARAADETLGSTDRTQRFLDPEGWDKVEAEVGHERRTERGAGEADAGPAAAPGVRGAGAGAEHPGDAPEGASGLGRSPEGGGEAPGEGARPRGADELGDIPFEGGPRLRESEPKIAPAPPFYSALERNVEAAKFEKGPAALWKNFIRNLSQKGVKQEEMDWTGVQDWLDQQKGVVSKADLLEAIRENNVQVQEVLRGRDRLAQGDEQRLSVLQSLNDIGRLPAEAEAEYERLIRQAGGTGNETKYSSYTLPGGKDYRELLLTMPKRADNALHDYLNLYPSVMREIRTPQDVADAARLNANFRENVKGMTPEAVLQAIEDVKAGKKPQPTFTQGHFEEPNVLAHVRFNDRTDAQGKRVLFLEELQSDWHQRGRRKGYQEEGDALIGGKTAMQWNDEAAKLLGEIGRDPVKQAQFEQMIRNRDELYARGRPGDSVPDAPFKTSWHELALKRMVRWAAENGYDKVAWTTGEQQAGRYDLSKQISRIVLDDNSSGGIGPPKMEGPFEAGRLVAYDHDGNEVVSKYIRDPGELADAVGKEAADKLLAKEPVAERDAGLGVRRRAIEGLDLKVGGEGMKGFYDKILPAAANKIGKKFGVKVGATEVPIGASYGRRWQVRDRLGGHVRDFDTEGAAEAYLADRNNGVPGGRVQLSPAMEVPTERVHALDITPAMRDSVMQGQALFEGQPTHDVGKYNSRLTDFTAALQQHGFTGSARKINEGAIAWVQARGEATKHEHLVLADATGTFVWDAATSLKLNSVAFSDAALKALQTPGNSINLHHNHPRGTALSAEDLHILQHPGANWVAAYTPDGGLTAARLSDQMRANPKALKDFVRQVNATENRVLAVLQKAADAGKISVNDANQIYGELKNRALHAAGVIDYVTTFVGEFENHPVVREALADATRGATFFWSHVHDLKGPDRPTVAVRPAEGVDRILGRDEGSRPAGPERPLGGLESESGAGAAPQAPPAGGPRPPEGRLTPQYQADYTPRYEPGARQGRLLEGAGEEDPRDIGPLKENFKEYIARLQAEKQARLDRATAIVGEDARPVVLTDDAGAKGVIVTPSTDEPGKWQATRFDKYGFSGHDVFNTKAEAAEEALAWKYEKVNPDALRTLAKTEDWRRGTEQAEQIQRENAARYEASRKSPATEKTDQGDQHILPGAEQKTPQEIAAAKRQAEKERAELAMKGKKRGAVGQEGAETLPLFGGERQKSLFEGGSGITPPGGGPPKGPDDPHLPEPMRGPMRRVIEAGDKWFPALRGFLSGATRDLQLKTVPMAAGSPGEQAAAKNFNNGRRAAWWNWDQIDRSIAKHFTPDQRREMGRALDNESVAAQMGLPAPADGLASLDARQRAVVNALDEFGRRLWARARELGIVHSEGLPYYMPRMVVNLGEDGTVSKVGKGPRTATGEGVGANLFTTTPNLKQRQYKTRAEFEAAIDKAFGPNATMVEDVRSLPLALRRLEEAIAGRELVNQIREMGKHIGTETVSESARPGFFTLDHPALKEYRPRYTKGEDGKSVALKDAAGNTVLDRVPIHVSEAFRGPLEAVLSKPTGDLYKAMMRLKGGAMSVIMWSPLIHNMVEFGRALPTLPGKVLTLKVYFEGNALKNTPEEMREAIRGGLVPMQRHFGWKQDVTGIMEEPNLQPGRSLLAKGLGKVGDVVGLGDPIRRGVDAAGDFWHQKLLWERIGDLQAGLYKNTRDDMVRKGFDRETAVKTAARIANNFAGVMPQEAMSDAARKIANLTLFSRSFTLGNLAVLKDAITGLPRDAQAQILQSSGEAARAGAVSYARRKAIGAIAFDIGLMYVMNSLLQDAFNAMGTSQAAGTIGGGAAGLVGGALATRGNPLGALAGAGLGALAGHSLTTAAPRQSLAQIEQGYVDRFQSLMREGREHPLHVLNPFHDMARLSSTDVNEPGRQERFYYGSDTKGTSIYGKNPVGKLGEEYLGWASRPFEMLWNKLGTFLKPALEIAKNDKGFGHPIYNEKDKTPEGVMRALGKVVTHMAEAQIPMSSLEAAKDALTGSGDQTINTLKTVGPLMGVTFSKGAPSGPVEGLLADERKQRAARIAEAMPDIKKQIDAGDLDGAYGRMAELGMSRQQIHAHIKQQISPASRVTPEALRRFARAASPETAERMERAQEEQRRRSNP